MKILTFLIVLLLGSAQIALADNFTISGTIKGSSLTVSSPVTPPNGGTGQSSYTTGDTLAASSSTALTRIPAVGAGSVFASAGVGAAPVWTSAPTISGNLTAASFLTGSSTYGPTGAIVNGGISGTNGTFTGAIRGAEGSGATNGFGFTEPANDTGMFSPSDGVADLYANGTKEVDVQTTGVTLYSGLTGTTGSFSGAVSGTTGTFSGAVSGTTGTFSGAVSGASYTGGAISGTTGTFSGAVTSPTVSKIFLQGTQLTSSPHREWWTGTTSVGTTTVNFHQSFTATPQCIVSVGGGVAADTIALGAITTSAAQLSDGATDTYYLMCEGQ